MSDNALKAVIAICGVLMTALQVVSIAMGRWKAGRDFDIARGQNQALEDIKAARGVETLAPPAASPRRRGRLLPRAPTPLPFFPVTASHAEAVPEPIENEQTTPPETPRRKT